MTERQASPSQDTLNRQDQAAAPHDSVWVSANAGSGKTHVLTQRVLRLLLSGAAPENILCLTYTKAAAANMRSRVSNRLAEWALMDDAALRAELGRLENHGPNEDQIRLARTLFARALETPGGLKINTIHAFCEAVLHRFPLEAGVPFDFQVIEDAEQGELIRQAREDVLSEGLDSALGESGAVRTLFDLMSDTGIEEAIGAALSAMRTLRDVLANPAAAKKRLRQLVAYRPEDTRAVLLEKTVTETLLPRERFAEVLAVCPPDDSKNRFEDKLARLGRDGVTAEGLFTCFLKADGTLPARFPKKDLVEAPGGLGDTLLAEAERLADLKVRLRKADLVARSEALLDVIVAIAGRYEAQKRTRSLLDFDDLVERLAALLSDGDQAEWVRYKLDAGITHVLVDESQDTNPEQWIVVDKLVEEFFGGESAVERPRTVFGVGDPKQSIFSFQGAEPRLFVETGAKYRQAALESGKVLHEIDLPASFRTQAGILDAVDRVFADPARAAALLRPQGVTHESARTDPGGSVTLWPPFEAPELEVHDQWPLPDEAAAMTSADRKLAGTIAGTIENWIGKRELGARERTVTADDIMILVQSRGPLFHEIIRALKERGINSPGADKLPVTGHIAILDLLALADVLLHPADDLGLAALLRSPLFDVSEDDLFDLCHNRVGTVWAALQCSALPSAREAFERLNRWRDRLDFDRPFEFFAQVLYAEGGLKRFHARLGLEVDEVIAEFLDLALAHEKNPRLSLQGFLAEMRAADISIKRELPETGSGVRVMTVHGAKGLEAPIVFIADAASKPEGTNLRTPLYVVGPPEGPMLFHAPGQEAHVPETMDFREADEAKQKDEYWRKLYVAMTRAEDELHVFATLNRKKGERDVKLKDSWYAALEQSLEAESEHAEHGGLDVRIFPAQRPEPKPIRHIPSPADLKIVLPDVAAPVPPLASRRTIKPSVAKLTAPLEDVLNRPGEALRDAETARQEGIALHALLQHLGGIDASLRETVAARALEQLLPDLPDRHAAVSEKALSILRTEALAFLFGPDSRAEVPILAHGRQGSEPIRIAGRIDRLMVTPERVLIVDFKSDALPPEVIPAPYAAQLGLYALVMKKLFAEREIAAAIFWTQTEKLVELAELPDAAALGGIRLE